MGKDLQELIDKLCEGAKVMTKELTPVIAKGSLTPQEVDTLYKAACFAEKLAKACGMEENEMSYGNMYGYGSNNMAMDMNGYSERRGRSPVTGRYISRGMNGTSGHSVEDRMIARLEEEMDNAQSDYERKMIQDEIHRIRMGMR